MHVDIYLSIDIIAHIKHSYPLDLKGDTYLVTSLIY